MSFRTIAIAMFIIGFVWLGAVLAFVLIGLRADRTADGGSVIFSLAFSGLVPALLFWTIGAIFRRQHHIDEGRGRGDLE